MPKRYRRKIGRFAARRRSSQRTSKRRRVAVRRGRNGRAVIAPRAAVKAIARIAQDNATETCYESYGLPSTWGGFTTNSDPVHTTQSAVINDLFDATITDGVTNLKNKQGVEVNLRRLDLFFDIQFKARQGNSELYCNPGRYPPPWMLCEMWICQMNSTQLANANSSETVPDSAEFSDAMWVDRRWCGRKLRPEFFDPRKFGAKEVRRRWKVLYYRVLRFKPNYINSKVPTGTKTVVTSAGIPTGLIDAASGLQPFNHIVDTDSVQTTSQSLLYKHFPMYKARPIKYYDTGGTLAQQTAGRVFMATRWWHPSGYDYGRTLEIPAGVEQIDHYEDVVCSVYHRMTYKP